MGRTKESELKDLEVDGQLGVSEKQDDTDQTLKESDLLLIELNKSIDLLTDVIEKIKSGRGLMLASDDEKKLVEAKSRLQNLIPESDESK